jgi:anti-sigma factor RsiW
VTSKLSHPTPEEWRLLDDELDETARRRLEKALADDPARAARLAAAAEDWQGDMSLWRADVHRRSPHFDPAVLARRVLAGPLPVAFLTTPHPRRYAIAAAALLALGLAGATWTGSGSPSPALAATPSLTHLETDRLNVQVKLEMELVTPSAFGAPRAVARPRGER